MSRDPCHTLEWQRGNPCEHGTGRSGREPREPRDESCCQRHGDERHGHYVCERGHEREHPEERDRYRQSGGLSDEGECNRCGQPAPLTPHCLLDPAGGKLREEQEARHCRNRQAKPGVERNVGAGNEHPRCNDRERSHTVAPASG